MRPLHERNDERKMSVISSISAKKEGNSRAIGRIFSRNRGNSSHFYSSFLSCKGLTINNMSKNTSILPIQNIKTNLITGFLGVGKSSTILQLMSQKPTDEDWSILVNEFGSIGIDGAIYKSQGIHGISVKEIPGGCMCCAAGVPLHVAINQLIKATRPHRLLIEPSGLGHPQRILDTLKSEHFQGVLDIHASICLIDPKYLLDERYATHENFIDQIAMADVLVANKMDTCDAKTEEHFDSYVSALKPPKLDIVKTSFGQLDISLLDTTADTQRKAQHPEHHHPKNTTHSPVTDGYQSTGYTFPKETLFDDDKIIALFEEWDIERIKAVLHTNKGWKVFNSLNQQLSITDINDFDDNRIELIGRVEKTLLETDKETLASAIKDCII